MRDAYFLPLLLLLAAAVFFVHLGGYDFYHADEARFAQVTREMMASGDYFSPHYNGAPYKEKPPLFFWSIAGVAGLLGGVNEFTARTPSVLAALVALICTFLLAKRLFDSRTAFWAGVILITSYRFWWQARFAQIDMLLTACLAAALLCFWNWHSTGRKAWLAGFYAAVTAALYAKGPGVIVFPALLILAFYWRRGQFRRQFLLGAGLAIPALIYAAWLIPAGIAASAENQTAASNAISSNLIRQTVGRFLLGVAHVQAPWYYLQNLPADYLPWALFLPWTLLWAWRHRKDGDAMRLLFSWMLPALIFFSIALGKRPVYLLPLAPAIAMLLARSVLALIDGEHALWRRRTALLWSAAMLGVGIAPWVLLLTPYHGLWNYGLAVISFTGFFFSVRTFRQARRSELRSLHASMAGHAALLAALCAIAVLPLANQTKSPRAFCEPIRQLADSGTRFALYSVGDPDEPYLYYARHLYTPLYSEFPELKSTENLSTFQQLILAKKLHDTVSKASSAVPVASIDHIADSELAALQKAVTESVARQKVDPAVRDEYVQWLNAATRRFLDTFSGASPAFLLASERDWRWILALHPEAHQLIVSQARLVGGHRMLLIANRGGQERIAKYLTPEPETIRVLAESRAGDS